MEWGSSGPGASARLCVGAVLLTFALQMGTIYIPGLNPIFKTEPLDRDELLVSLALSSVSLSASKSRNG